MIATAAVALALAAPGVVQAQTTKAQREEFASQVIGLSMAYYEARFLVWRCIPSLAMPKLLLPLPGQYVQCTVM